MENYSSCNECLSKIESDKGNNVYYVDVDGQRAMIQIKVPHFKEDVNSLKTSILTLDSFIEMSKHCDNSKSSNNVFIINVCYGDAYDSLVFNIYTNYFNDEYYSIIKNFVSQFRKFLLDKYSLYCSELKENAD